MIPCQWGNNPGSCRQQRSSRQRFALINLFGQCTLVLTETLFRPQRLLHCEALWHRTEQLFSELKCVTIHICYFFYISVRIVCSISCTEGNLLGSGTSQWFLVLHLRQLPALIFQSLLKHYSNYPPLLSITSLTFFLTFFLFAVSGAASTRRAESRSIPQDLCRRLNRPLWTVADWAHQKDQSRQTQNHRRWHSRCRGVSFGFLLCFEMYLPAAYTLPSILKCKCTSTFFFLREQRWNKEAQNRGDMRSPGFAPTKWKPQSTVLDKAAKVVQTCSDLKRCVFSAFPWYDSTTAWKLRNNTHFWISPGD